MSKLLLLVLSLELLLSGLLSMLSSAVVQGAKSGARGRVWAEASGESVDAKSSVQGRPGRRRSQRGRAC